MDINIQVPFQKLLEIVKGLTAIQKTKLIQELSHEKPNKEDKKDFLEFLLTGPVYTKKEIANIEENRKSISAWRTKN
jgi:hypothetical protein